MAVHTRKEEVWVSYDPNGIKVECPRRSNRDKDICVTFTQKSATVPLRKRDKKVWQPTQSKGNVWNKRKRKGL